MTEDASDADGADEHEEPPREEFSHDPVSHVDVRAGMSVADLVAGYGDAGIGAADLHEAVDVTAELFDDDVTTLMGLAGAMVQIGRASCRERV